MEADLGDFSNTNCPLIESRTASLESSMALSGCFRATGAEVSAELARLLREQSEAILASVARIRVAFLDAIGNDRTSVPRHERQAAIAMETRWQPGIWLYGPFWSPSIADCRMVPARFTKSENTR
jgi:hypothetical protein